MTYEEMKKDIEEYKKLKEAYNRGEIDDGMTDEERRAWIERCNSQLEGRTDRPQVRAGEARHRLQQGDRARSLEGHARRG